MGTALLVRHIPRYQALLDRVVAGQSSKVIGQALGISERTVEKFRGNIMRKTQADSVAALVRLVLFQRQDAGRARGS